MQWIKPELGEFGYKLAREVLRRTLGSMDRYTLADQTCHLP
ncbi:MAG: hypothetical protein V3V97_02955 [Hyphomicrobiaceae bacterium]